MTGQYGLFIRGLIRKMLNQNKLRKLEEKKRELLSNIHLCEDTKKKIIDFVQALNNQYDEGLISYEVYSEKLKEVLNLRTAEQWIKYYDEYIEYCRRHLENCINNISEEKKKNKSASIMAILAILVILGLSLFFLRPILTGLVVGEESYTQNLGLIINESSIYELQLEHIGVLKSAKISGSLLGDGNVKVYLDDKLILDNSELEESRIKKITGLIVSGLTGWFIEDADIAEEETIIESENETSETIENETSEILENETSEGIDETIEGETAETGTQDVKEISFENICIETCSLELNKTSYELRVEIDGTVLELDSIKYVIASSEEQEDVDVIKAEKLIQGPAEINKPVKWFKNISLEKEKSNLTVVLPRDISNLKVRKVTGEIREEIGEDKLKISEIKRKKSLKENLITLHVIRGVEEDEKEVELIIEDNVMEVEIEFETEAPKSFEENLANKKSIIISGHDDLHYENVLAYTTLSKEVSEGRIKLYRTTEGIKEQTEFTAYDKNDNGMIDYIEWIVPLLSNQSYEIIYIEKAEHLDENRSFISNIYDEVKELDGVWSEAIHDGEYVRVTFERNLTNKNDITIYPRVVSENPRIEVYELDGTTKIAEFSSLNSNEYNKVYLTKLGQGECYDIETEILTENGWKFFRDLEDEKVATLNQETGEKEWQLPLERQEFDSPEFMYKIVLEDGSDLLVSGKHRVYSASKSSLSSSVVNTLTAFLINSSWKCESFDQIGQFNLSANAKYCSSSGSEISEAARFNCCGETLAFKLTNFDNISFILSNLFSETLSNSQSSSECSSNSSSINLCEYNSKECSCANFLVNEPFFSNENAMLASITNFIYLPLDSFANFSLTSLANLMQSSSVNLLSLVNSSSSLNSFVLCDLSSNSCLTNSDQTTQTNLDNLFLNSSSIANVTDAIYNSPLAFNSSIFSSSSSFLITTLRATSATFTSGNSFLNLANNSSGICTLILNDFAILTPCSVYFNKSNYFDIYKSFDEKDLSKFSLQSITETYEEINNGKEIYFLNAENKPIRVKSITKQAYDGKIYGVDVPNDIVLVKRKPKDDKKELLAHTSSQINNIVNGKTQSDDSNLQISDDLLINSLDNPSSLGKDNFIEINRKLIDISGGFWSGNSESYSQDTFDLRVVGGILEFEHIIDPAEENITNYTASGTFTVPAGVTSITVRAWGGGGGGGGSSSWNKGGSGGGGGQYAEANISVTEGQVFDITIGGGGAAGAQGNNPGGAGGNTIFFNATQTYVRAIGGTGGAGNALAAGSGNLEGSIGNIKFYGGGGGTGGDSGGGGGGGAGTTQNGSYGIGGTAGAGGSLYGGNGGAGEVNANGNPGSNYGGAGGGGERALFSDEAGGAGAQGFSQVIYKLDEIYPIFSNYWDNNATLIGGGTGLFNVTVKNTNGTVLLEINNTNITATNYAGDNYNASYDFTSNGTYAYRWHSWGNGTSHNYNKSVKRDYVVNESYAPQIVNVYNETMDNGGISDGPNEGPDPTYMIINFTAYDENGFENLNHSSAKINVSKSGEVPRVNSSCYNTANYSTYYANYTCSVSMAWWDGSGIWTINATISDNNANSGENSSMTFFVGVTDAFVMNPTVLTWNDLTAGGTNQEANENILMNNTGNVAKYINVNATNLYGETDSDLALWAGNFTVKNAAGCEGTAMVVNTFVNVTSTALPVGNFTLNDGSTGQENVYVCLEQAGSELIAQAYSTGNADWAFKIVTQ